jgi:hypothetical protein
VRFSDGLHHVEDAPSAFHVNEEEIELGSAGALEHLVVAAELTGEEPAGDVVVGLQCVKADEACELGGGHALDCFQASQLDTPCSGLCRTGQGH